MFRRNIQKKNTQKYTEGNIYTHTEMNIHKYTKIFSIQIASINAQRYSIRLSRIAFNPLTENRTAAYQNSGS